MDFLGRQNERYKPAMNLRLACLLLSLVVTFPLVTAKASLLPPPALPPHASVAIGNSSDLLWLVWDGKTGFSSYRRWNPISGVEKEYPFPKDPGFDSIVATRHGLWFDARNKQNTNNNTNQIGTGSFWLVTEPGKVLSVPLGVARLRPRLLVLADQSVLLLGGIVEWGGNGKPRKFSSAVERVAYADGKLSVERLPDLPGPTRTAYGLIALPDGRAMVLGGSPSEWIGCAPCSADTYFVDVSKKTWSAGPPLNEARANPSVTQLPDGSVLVAGGWTPGHGDGGWGVTSHTTERWSPATGRFTTGSTMLTGTAMHRAVWAAGQEGKRLLLAGGNSAAVQSYDVTSDRWQVVAELCEPHETDQVVPFLFQGQPHLWLLDGKAGWCKEGRHDAAPHLTRTLVNLRLGVQAFDPQVGMTLNRYDFHFVPGTGNGPSHVVGGRVAGNGQKTIEDAHSIWPEGRIEPVAKDKVSYPSQVDMGTMPPLNRDRNDSTGNYWPIAKKRLPDGRTIVAGGEVQVHKIAVVTERSLTPGTPDEYIGIGEYLPSRRHEIHAPATGAWRNSAPSVGAGGPVAIFDDGRVVKLGRLAAKTTGGVTEPEQFVLEISSPDGNSWSRLDSDLPPALRFSYLARPFIIQDELFLSGQLREDGSGGGAELVLWRDTIENRWVELWRVAPGDNWRHHIGRIIVRGLPNGKRIVMPVGGF